MQKHQAGHVSSHSWMSRCGPTLDLNVCSNGQNAVAKESNITSPVRVKSIMTRLILCKIYRFAC